MTAEQTPTFDETSPDPKLVLEANYMWEFVKEIHAPHERWLDEEGFLCLFSTHMFYRGMLDRKSLALKDEYRRRPKYLFSMALSAETAIEAARAGLHGAIVLRIAAEVSNWRGFAAMPPELDAALEKARLDLATRFPEVAELKARQFTHIAVPWLIRNGHFEGIEIEEEGETCVGSGDRCTIFRVCAIEDQVPELYQLARKIFGFARDKLEMSLFREVVHEVLASRQLVAWSDGRTLSEQSSGSFSVGWALVLQVCLAAEAVYRRLQKGATAKDALHVVLDTCAYREVADLDDGILEFAQLMQARFAAGYPGIGNMPNYAFAHLILPWLVRKRYVDECEPL